jgi:hypothetical protein
MEPNPPTAVNKAGFRRGIGTSSAPSELQCPVLPVRPSFAGKPKPTTIHRVAPRPPAITKGGSFTAQSYQASCVRAILYSRAWAS